MERQKFLDAISSSEGKKRIDKILEYSLYLRQVDAEESANQAKIVLEYALSHQENYLETVALAYICTAYFYKSDFDQVIYWSDQLFEKGQKYGDNKSMGDSYNLKARLAFSLDDLTTAQENLLKALEYLIKTDSLMDLLSCYNGLGLIHLAKEELDEAHHFLNLALEIAEQKGSEAQHSIRLNISNILYGQRKFEEALAVNMKTLEFYQDNDRISMKATALNNIALCHRNLGDSEKALEYFKEAYLFYHKTKQYNELCRCCNSLANLYIDSQDWVKAEEYLKEAKQLGETHDLKFSLLAVHNSYSSYHEAKGDFQAANEYLRKRFNLNKELTQESNHEKLAELETKYKTEIYKLKTAELDKKNKGMSNQIVELNESLSDLQTTYLSLQNDFEKVVERVNAQDDLLSSQSRMSMMGGMISAIAHQWKQPLNVIWVLVQAIDDSWRFDELNEEFMDNQVKQIGEQVHYMAETVNDFSKFFKPDYVQEYSVAETIEKALKLLAYMLKSIGISLIKELDGNCRLSGNPNELNQVIINIINNAREAIMRDKIIAPEIRIRMNCNKELISITIYNKGNHIKPENLEKIFEPYFTTRGKEGTGIGLQICRQIIENKYNGTINANNCDYGVEFVIEMPKLQR